MTLWESNVKKEHKQYLALSQRPSGFDQLRLVGSYADGFRCERRCTFEWHCRYGDSSTLWYGHIQQKFAGYTQSQRAYGAFVISKHRSLDVYVSGTHFSLWMLKRWRRQRRQQHRHRQRATQPSASLTAVTHNLYTPNKTAWYRICDLREFSACLAIDTSGAIHCVYFMCQILSWNSYRAIKFITVACFSKKKVSISSEYYCKWIIAS